MKMHEDSWGAYGGYDDLTYAEKLELLGAYRQHWGTNLKDRAENERQRSMTTAANKRRMKAKTKTRSRRLRKLNRRKR